MTANLTEVRAPLDGVEFLVERYGWEMADYGAADRPEASAHFKKALSLKRDLLDAVERAVEDAVEESQKPLQEQYEQLKRVLAHVAMSSCSGCGRDWPHPAALSSHPVCELCRAAETERAVARVKMEALEATVWEITCDERLTDDQMNRVAALREQYEKEAGDDNE